MCNAALCWALAFRLLGRQRSRGWVTQRILVLLRPRSGNRLIIPRPLFTERQFVEERSRSPSSRRQSERDHRSAVPCVRWCSRPRGRQGSYGAALRVDLPLRGGEVPRRASVRRASGLVDGCARTTVNTLGISQCIQCGVDGHYGIAMIVF